MSQATAQGLKRFIAMQKLHKKASEGKAMPGDPLSKFDMMQAKKKK